MEELKLLLPLLQGAGHDAYWLAIVYLLIGPMEGIIAVSGIYLIIPVLFESIAKCIKALD